MGAVYLAMHEAINRTVALKLLLPNLALKPAYRRRFQDEAKASNSVDDPGLVDILDYGHTTDGAAYLVMPYLVGETLQVRIYERDPVETRSVLRLGLLMAQTLARVHAQGIIHRDLKPTNVMIVKDGAVPGGERTKILDFGIAKLPDPVALLSQPGANPAAEQIGTPAYMPPEQIRGDVGLDGRADVYALGVVLYEMLARRRPFSGRTRQELFSQKVTLDPPPLLEATHALPRLVALVQAMLARRQEERPAMREVADSLEQMLEAPPVSAPAPARPLPRPLALAGGMLLVAGVLMMLYGFGANWVNGECVHGDCWQRYHAPRWLTLGAPVLGGGATLLVSVLLRGALRRSRGLPALLLLGLSLLCGCERLYGGLWQRNDECPRGATDAGEQTTSWLGVRGKYIVRGKYSDGGKDSDRYACAWHARGANLYDTRSCNACTFAPANLPDALRRLDELIGGWHANFVRISLESYRQADEPSPDTGTKPRVNYKGILDCAEGDGDCDRYLQDIRSLVGHVGSKYPGVYVMLSLKTDSTVSPEDGQPTQRTNEVWQRLAREFRNTPQVLFGVIDDFRYFDTYYWHPKPGKAPPSAQTVWESRNAAVAAIREVEDLSGTPHHVIAVQEVGKPSDPAPPPITAGGGDRIAYEVGGSDRAELALHLKRFSDVPVILSFGPHEGDDGGQPTLRALEECQRLMDQAEVDQRPYLAFTFHHHCAGPYDLLQDPAPRGPDHCALPQLVPTAWGRLLRAQLQKPYPGE